MGLRAMDAVIYNQCQDVGQRTGSRVRLVLPTAVGVIPLIYALLQAGQMRTDQARIELILVATVWVLFVSSLMGPPHPLATEKPLLRG